MFLKLTDSNDGQKLLLNSNQIRLMSPITTDRKDKAKTFISDMNDDGEWYVLETMEEIEQQLKGQKTSNKLLWTGSRIFYDFEVELKEEPLAGLHGGYETISVSTKSHELDNEEQQYLQQVLAEYYNGKVVSISRRIE